MEIIFTGSSKRKVELGERVQLYITSKRIKINNFNNDRICPLVESDKKVPERFLMSLLNDGQEAVVIKFENNISSIDSKEYPFEVTCKVILDMNEEFFNNKLQLFYEQEKANEIKSKEMKYSKTLEQQIGIIKTMIENNDKGLCGFWLDKFECEGCGNENVISAFKRNNSITLPHIVCPYDNRILYPNCSCSNYGDGCAYHCSKYDLTKQEEIRKNVLTRFLENLKNNLYKSVYFEGMNKHILPEIITKEEIDTIKASKAKDEEMERVRYEKGILTQTNKANNMIVFNGNNLNPIPEELFNLFAIILDDYEKELENFLNKYDGRERQNFYTAITDFTKSEAYLGGDEWDYECDDTYTLLPFNTSVGLSIYKDEETGKLLFAIMMGSCGLESCRDSLICVANDSLKNLYYKWKKFKNDNSNKYNKPYKESKYAILNNTARFNNQILCESCLMENHCDRVFCLYGEKIIKISKKEQFKINLHILEPCNYRCKHCFAHFDNNKVLPLNHWKHIIDNCVNSIFTHEFNIAGGEPFMYKDLDKLIEYIHLIGCDCSIITNGFFMDEDWIKKNTPYMKTIGFSIDSFVPETLIKMGRANVKGEYLSKERFSELCNLIKKYNPKCNIKINTVVTSLNKDEVLSTVIENLKIPVNRWKIFKMDIFKNEEFDNSSIQITDDEYDLFVKNNTTSVESSPSPSIYESEVLSKKFEVSKEFTIIAERDVNASYIMIDANGYLVDDSLNDSYTPIINCATEEFEEGFKKLSFNKDLYFSRYKD